MSFWQITILNVLNRNTPRSNKAPWRSKGIVLMDRLGRRGNIVSQPPEQLSVAVIIGEPAAIKAIVATVS